ncbi:MAG: hypothetical protein DLM73_15845 [Chthoniobacterales bacterium]|nr:MAG: hypothetical protein DLM73_15845 [Chthoniobacterales bacterium]
MKRFQLLVLASAITAGAIWFGFYRSRHTSTVAVASLLPRETLAFIHIPDFNRARGELHETEVYKLWREPAVQDFLQKPRAKMPASSTVGPTIEEIESIGMKDAFVAVVSLEYSAWKIVGGFRYKADDAAAEKLVNHWRAKTLGGASDVKHETVDYQGRQIQTDSAGILNFSSVHAGQWFFFANDAERLKPLLDRADGRVKDPQTVLSGDDTFLAAFHHMPSSYAAVGYARVDQLLEKLMPAAEKNADGGMTVVRKIQSFCGATSFDDGKIRDTFFVGMPKVIETGNLTRGSLSIATKETFLYVASFLNLSKEMELGPQAAAGWLGGFQKITSALATNGVTLEEWKSAFGDEFSLMADWPATARIPSLFATLPVKDSAKAKKILTTLAANKTDDTEWTQQEKDGVIYFSTASGAKLLSLSPTIGLSDRMLVAGADAESVEAAMKRSAAGNSELAASKKFKTAERALPTARQAFAFVDPALIYTRLDATLRPMLFMSAAFLPGIADTVDLNKLPAAEVITKHLSPITMSQSYDGDGYVAESIGPFTVYQTLFGIGAASGAATLLYHQQTPGMAPIPTISSPAPSLSPAGSPSPSPDDSP